MDYTWAVLYTAGEWAIRVVMLFYVPYRRDAAAARVWLLLIFFLPYLGLPLYFLFGGVSVRNRFERAADRYALTGSGWWPWLKANSKAETLRLGESSARSIDLA